MGLTDKLKHAWNAFSLMSTPVGYAQSSSRPTHRQSRSIRPQIYVSSIYNRIALDVAMTSFKHVKIEPSNEDETEIKSGLNTCLTEEANIDQTHIQLVQDIVFSMFDEGVVAVVPIETTISPLSSGGYDIKSLRVGKITQWMPKHVEVMLYNEDKGIDEKIVIEKRMVAIIENPLFATINDENSTLKRLTRKLGQLDNVDELADSKRLDMLISVPYAIKTDAQKEMAKKRIVDIEEQLASGKNGIAYLDGVEKALQLNRPTNNQLPETIKGLEDKFYNQIGLTANIFNGTAGETETKNYNARTIDPIAKAITSEFSRKFLTKTARTQGHKIIFYRDMFQLVSAEVIGSLGDSFRRNYIASSNELRKLVGLARSNDPRADELFNPNIADNNQSVGRSSGTQLPAKEEEPGSPTPPDQ